MYCCICVIVCVCVGLPVLDWGGLGDKLISCGGSNTKTPGSWYMGKLLTRLYFHKIEDIMLIKTIARIDTSTIVI